MYIGTSYTNIKTTKYYGIMLPDSKKIAVVVRQVTLLACLLGTVSRYFKHRTQSGVNVEHEVKFSMKCQAS